MAGISVGTQAPPSSISPSGGGLRHRLRDRAMSEEVRLRALAAWYREFAEVAGNPWIWEARLQTAETLEAEADGIESAERSQGVA